MPSLSTTITKEVIMSRALEALAAKQQRQFDKEYITSSEIVQTMGVSRVAMLNARKRGILPEPITVFGVGSHIWVRKEIKSHLKAWAFTLGVKRGEING